jgi:hypothetical protein
MINLKKGVTSTVYFTGTEKATLTNPRFLFVFLNRGSKVTFKVNVANTSTDARYDKAVINSSVTADYEPALYEYTIYEKSNTDTTESGTIVETGYMILRAASEFEMTEYNEQTNTFKVYDGQ